MTVTKIFALHANAIIVIKIIIILNNYSWAQEGEIFFLEILRNAAITLPLASLLLRSVGFIS